MFASTGFSPSISAIPGSAQERPQPAVQALQAEAAKGRTPGTGGATLTSSGITGPLAGEKAWRTGTRSLPHEIERRPDSDTLAGPPPAFEFTPLEKLRYPPSPLEDLARRAKSGDLLRDDDAASAPASDHDAPATGGDPAPAAEAVPYGQVAPIATTGTAPHEFDVRR